MLYYNDEKPRWIRQIDHQHIWSINVWAGIAGQYLFGPFFYGIVTGAVYQKFLENHLTDLLPVTIRDDREEMWFQHDGAPPHFAVAVRNWLNQEFTNMWIGRGGPVPWPPRPQEIISLDYYLWGYVKKVYTKVPTTRENTQIRIHEANC